MVFMSKRQKMFITSGVTCFGVGWRWLALVLWGCLAMGQAQANCTYSVVASPVYPSRLLSTTLPANRLIFKTNLHYNFTCDPVTLTNTSSALVFYFDATLKATALVGPITGVSVKADPPTFSNASAGCNGFKYSESSRDIAIYAGSTTVSCSFTTSIPVSYYTNGEAYSFTNGVANTSSTQYLTGKVIRSAGGGNNYFIVDGSTAYGNHTATGQIGINSFSMAEPNKTCMVTAGAVQNVLLGRVSPTDPNLINNMGAGFKRFPINVTCTPNPNGTVALTTLKATVNYTSAYLKNSAANPAWIYNSAANPAANVYILLFDAGQSALGDGSSVTMTQNGDTFFAAQYMNSDKKNIGVGDVLGQFTLLFSYQ